MTADRYQALDRWIDAHFDEEVAFLQALVRVPQRHPARQQRTAFIASK